MYFEPNHFNRFQAMPGSVLRRLLMVFKEDADV